MHPASQLFLFSTQFNEQVSNWFSGSVIQEIDLRLTRKIDIEELEQLVTILKLTGKHPTKVTVVMNYNVQGLTMATMTGAFDFACRLKGEQDYIDLNKLHHIATYASHATFMFNEAYVHLKSLPRKMNGDDYKLSRSTHKVLRNNLAITSDSLSAFRATLNDVFINKFQSNF